MNKVIAWLKNRDFEAKHEESMHDTVGDRIRDEADITVEIVTAITVGLIIIISIIKYFS